MIDLQYSQQVKKFLVRHRSALTSSRNIYISDVSGHEREEIIARAIKDAYAYVRKLVDDFDETSSGKVFVDRLIILYENLLLMTGKQGKYGNRRDTPEQTYRGCYFYFMRKAIFSELQYLQNQGLISTVYLVRGYAFAVSGCNEV